jgi:hypothetical protein
MMNDFNEDYNDDDMESRNKFEEVNTKKKCN